MAPCPALYAAVTKYHLPKYWCRSFRWAAAAYVDLTGSRRSSTHESILSLYLRAVVAINCQSPTAPFGEETCGEQPLSMSARYANYSAKPYSRRILAII